MSAGSGMKKAPNGSGGSGISVILQGPASEAEIAAGNRFETIGRFDAALENTDHGRFEDRSIP